MSHFFIMVNLVRAPFVKSLITVLLTVLSVICVVVAVSPGTLPASALRMFLPLYLVHLLSRLTFLFHLLSLLYYLSPNLCLMSPLKSLFLSLLLFVMGLVAVA